MKIALWEGNLDARLGEQAHDFEGNLALHLHNVALLHHPELKLEGQRSLAEEIKAQNCELVFMGKQSVDYDNCITGQLVAELLGYNCISVVVSFKLEGYKITAEREIEGGREVVETELPAIITAQKGLNEPRYASLKGIIDRKSTRLNSSHLGISYAVF